MNKENKIRVVDALGLVWCLAIMLVCFVITNYYACLVIFPSLRPHLWPDLTYFDKLFVMTILTVPSGMLLSYIPMVFLGIAPLVLVEATLYRSEGKNLQIPYHVWHGDYLPMSQGHTLCSHCWKTPLRLYAGIIDQIIMACLFCLRTLSIVIYFTFMSLLQKERNSEFGFFETVWNCEISMDNLFIPTTQPAKTIQKKSGFLPALLAKTSNVLEMLKKKACPTISWQ